MTLSYDVMRTWPNFVERLRAIAGTHQVTSGSLIHSSRHKSVLVFEDEVENHVEWTGKSDVRKTEFPTAGEAFEAIF